MNHNMDKWQKKILMDIVLFKEFMQIYLGNDKISQHPKAHSFMKLLLASTYIKMRN